MPTRRTPTRRSVRRRINQQAIEAWKACDHNALHQALNLGPWELSPLPYAVTALGVAEDDDRGSGTPWGESWLQAIEFQRQLYEIAGPPDTEALGREYTKNLEDAREMLAYYQTAPYRGNDSNWREGQLQKTTEEVAWREQLLEQLLG